MPALHAGYLSFFNTHQPSKIFILGKSFIDAFPRLNRDLRALAPKEVIIGLNALGFDAEVLEIAVVRRINKYKQIILPDEDVSRGFKKKTSQAQRTNFRECFFALGRSYSQQTKNIQQIASTDELDREFMHQAEPKGKKALIGGDR